MLTAQQKSEIVAAIEREKGLLGSYNAVATKIESDGAGRFSASHISANFKKPENWANISDPTWKRVAAALAVSLSEARWVVADTRNIRQVRSTLALAQREAMMMGISDKAGSGKTASIRAYKAQDVAESVYLLECEEWSRRAFLLKLMGALGTKAEATGYVNCDAMLAAVVVFFKKRVGAGVTPLLVLDEADKLRDAAKRVLIPLYNKLEDEVGIVVCGTENLEKEINRGRERHLKGYDEISSRLGRNFIKLDGASLPDVTAICAANGITEPEAVSAIWDEAGPVRKDIKGRYVEVVEDLRRVKRLVKRERMKLALTEN